MGGFLYLNRFDGAGCGQKEARDMMQLIKLLPVDVYHKRVETMLDLELGAAYIDAGINRSRDRGRVTDGQEAEIRQRSRRSCCW